MKERDERIKMEKNGQVKRSLSKETEWALYIRKDNKEREKGHCGRERERQDVRMRKKGG